MRHNAVCSDMLLQYNTIQCNTSQYMMMQHYIMLRSRLEWSVILSLIGCCPTYFTSSFLFISFLFTNYATWHLDVCTFHLLLNRFPPNYHYVLILPTMTFPSVVIIFPLSSPGIEFCVPSVRTVRTWRPRPSTCTLTPHPYRRLIYRRRGCSVWWVNVSGCSQWSSARTRREERRWMVHMVLRQCSESWDKHHSTLYRISITLRQTVTSLKAGNSFLGRRQQYSSLSARDSYVIPLRTRSCLPTSSHLGINLSKEDISLSLSLSLSLFLPFSLSPSPTHYFSLLYIS